MVLRVGSVFPGYRGAVADGRAALVLAGRRAPAAGSAPTGSSAPGRWSTSATSASRCTCGTGRSCCCTWSPGTGRRSASVAGAFVIGLSLLLAALTYHFVEEPVRRSAIGTRTRWGAYRFGVVRWPCCW